MKSHLWASAILVALPLQAVFAADTPSAQDKTFVQQAAEGGMAEVQEGQLAELAGAERQGEAIWPANGQRAYRKQSRVDDLGPEKGAYAQRRPWTTNTRKKWRCFRSRRMLPLISAYIMGQVYRPPGDGFSYADGNPKRQRPGLKGFRAKNFAGRAAALADGPAASGLIRQRRCSHSSADDDGRQRQGSKREPWRSIKGCCAQAR